jgi:ankyrin repeat protein
MIKILTENGANLYYADLNKQTLLFYACREGIYFFSAGKKKCVDYFLEKGLKKNSVDSAGQTPIFYIAM